MTFSEWVQEHCIIFGVREEGMKTVLSWKLPFLAAGYTPEDLLEATNWLAVNRVPKFLNEHLEFLNDRIRHVRTVQAAVDRQKVKEDSFRTCTFCSNSGMVIVPHPRCLREGNWQSPWYTCAVACRCILGSRHRANIEKLAEEYPNRFRPTLRLTDYESTNPQWFQQMRQRDEARRMMAEAEAKVAHADGRDPTSMDRDVQRLMDSIRTKYITELA